MKIVFATNNRNKLEEVQALIPEHITLLSLEDIGCHEDIAETAPTLEGNAKIKANYVTENYQLPCFADDTGLEVDSLRGAPGVYSARYAGEDKNAEANIEKVLKKLNGSVERLAQFRTVIALNINKQKFLFEGVCKGEILDEPMGEEGFGYDPIFQPEGFMRSFAEMSMEDKSAISHRGIAVRKLIEFLNTL